VHYLANGYTCQYLEIAINLTYTTKNC